MNRFNRARMIVGIISDPKAVLHVWPKCTLEQYVDAIAICDKLRASYKKYEESK